MKERTHHSKQSRLLNDKVNAFKAIYDLKYEPQHNMICTQKRAIL